jgi:hypothetical protein
MATTTLSRHSASHQSAWECPLPASALVGATPLERYIDHRGFAREVICCPGADGTRLVIDRLTRTRSDQRLVAHLAADEPPQNASIVCSLYLADERPCRCRRLTLRDFEITPFASGAIRLLGELHTATVATDESVLLDQHGSSYALQEVRADLSIPELRWTRRSQDDHPDEAISLREVIGGLERYEPMRSITVGALTAHGCNPDISTAILRGELARLDTARIVLNRGLREAVLVAIRRGLSMSEIAIRCGRYKRGPHDGVSGETSWLARRIGLRPEGGKDAPTPWIHSETLALIARQGLGISPSEVELG